MFISTHQSLLERFEETVSNAGQEDFEANYDISDQDPEHSQVSREWSLDQEREQDPLISDRFQLAAESHSRPASQRSRLQDLLLTAKKRASSCFGARMDRIGNASGLGCNNGRGKAAARNKVMFYMDNENQDSEFCQNPFSFIRLVNAKQIQSWFHTGIRQYPSECLRFRGKLITTSQNVDMY